MTAEEYERLANEGGKHAALFRGMAQWCREQAVAAKFSDVEKNVIRQLRAGVKRENIAFTVGLSVSNLSRVILNIWRIIDEPRTNDAGLVFALGRRGLLV